MYDAIHLTNFVLCCACAGLKLWESGNSLDDFAPAEDMRHGVEAGKKIQTPPESPSQSLRASGDVVTVPVPFSGAFFRQREFSGGTLLTTDGRFFMTVKYPNAYSKTLEEDIAMVAEAASQDETCVGFIVWFHGKHSSGEIGTLHDRSKFTQLPHTSLDSILDSLPLVKMWGKPSWTSPLDPKDPLWNGHGQPSSDCSSKVEKGWKGWTAYSKETWASYSSSIGLEVFAKDGQDSADGDGSLTGASLHLVGFCSSAQSSRDTIEPNQRFPSSP